MSRVVALSGGVGGAKLAHGLALALPASELTVIVNTADDFEHLGLYISPDLDSVMYALAGLSDPVRGWGWREDTWNFMAALQRLGAPSWFQLGDRDLAVHVQRTWRLRAGARLSEVTRELCGGLGIAAQVLPMSDDPVRTQVRCGERWIPFQEYFVQRHCEPAVQAFSFEGAAQARALPEVLSALTRADLEAVIICPSNPFVSIEPILAVLGIRTALERTQAPVIAVTPIVGGKALKGPAAKMLAELALPVSAAGVASRYAGLLDAFVGDETDLLPEVPDVRCFRAATLMRTDTDRLNLARAVLRIAAELAVR
jgi:LPPG:FO 2-phospho-L-lactate transferase